MKKLSLKLIVGTILLMGVAGCMNLLGIEKGGECLHCGKYTSTYDASLKHSLEAHQIQEVCPLCREPVQSRRWFLRHLQENHPDRWRRFKDGEGITTKGVPLKELENTPKGKR
jgi:hypothetical protein